MRKGDDALGTVTEVKTAKTVTYHGHTAKQGTMFGHCERRVSQGRPRQARAAWCRHCFTKG